MNATTRGTVPIPNLDDRSWADLVAETRARIQARIDDWTDTSPGDFGITLVELFAWLVEGLTFRLNQVPDKNYAAFLNLLGIKRTPPRVARTRLVFTVAGAPVEFGAGQLPTQAEARRGDGTAPVVFELEEPVRALPWEAMIIARGAAPTSFTVPLRPQTGPGSSMPVLAFPAEGMGPGEVIWLCAGTTKLEGDSVAVWLPGALTDENVSAEWLQLGNGWRAASVKSDGTRSLTETGVVELDATGWQELPLPDSWSQDVPLPHPPLSTTPYRWLALRLRNNGPRLSFAGKPTLTLNSGEASTALTVFDEKLGVSDGSPFQTFALAHWPVQLGGGKDPYADLSVTVTTREGQVSRWRVSAALSARPGEASEVCRLDAASGELSFGDAGVGGGAPGAVVGGRIPPLGASLSVDRYRYVSAGKAGNIAALAISDLVNVSAGAAVGNPFAAVGGEDEESIEAAKARAPGLLRSRDRAVTTEDYERLALEASTDLRAARCLTPMLWTGAKRGSIEPNTPANFAGLNRASGSVTLIVVPTGSAPDPMPSAAPELLQGVRRYIEQRQPAGATLDVRSPFYLPIVVTLNVSLWPDDSRSLPLPVPTKAEYVALLERQITEFLHPTRGGTDGRGFAVGQRLHAQDIAEAVSIPRGLGFVTKIEVYPDQNPPYFADLPPTPADDRRPENLQPTTPPTYGDGTVVRTMDYELLCSAAKHAITVDFPV